MASLIYCIQSDLLNFKCLFSQKAELTYKQKCYVFVMRISGYGVRFHYISLVLSTCSSSPSFYYSLPGFVKDLVCTGSGFGFFTVLNV